MARNKYKNSKKTNGLSIAITAINVLIVGIIIMLIVLIYLHMISDEEQQRDEITAASVSESESSDISEALQTSFDTSVSASESDNDQTAYTVVSSESEFFTLPLNYDKEFFDNSLFIGDSISTGLYLYGYLDKSNVFAKVGLNPETAASHQIDGVTSIEKAENMQPDNIFIMLGTNGLASLDASYMANKMAELISALKQACPETSVYVISIPPVTKEHEEQGNETMEKVNAYNSKLRSVCEQSACTYIDLCSMLLDDEGYFSAVYAEEDGLHFLGNTYIAMLGVLEQTVSGG